MQEVCKTYFTQMPVFVSQLGEELSGIVEVIGMVSNKGTVMAAAYSMFREEKGISFGERSMLIIMDLRTAVHLLAHAVNRSANHVAAEPNIKS